MVAESKSGLQRASKCEAVKLGGKMRKATVILSILLSAGSVWALDCDTPAGTRAVRSGELVNNLTVTEEIALEEELELSCNEGIEYVRYYEDGSDQYPVDYKVDLICYEDSVGSVEETLDLVCVD